VVSGKLVRPYNYKIEEYSINSILEVIMVFTCYTHCLILIFTRDNNDIIEKSKKVKKGLADDFV
jgi:hypothetical protein